MHQRYRLLVLCLFGLGLVFSGTMVQGFPNLPYVSLPPIDTPNIWREIGECHGQLWVRYGEVLAYIEYGTVTEDDYQTIARDLLRGGWRNVREEFGFDHYWLWADLRTMEQMPKEVQVLLSALSSEELKVFVAHRGHWQVAIYIDETQSDPLYPGLAYLAICTPASGRKTPDWNLLPPRQFVVPGSQLIGLAVGQFDDSPVEMYSFQTTSPVDAVVAHFRGLSPDWIIYSAGIHGAFGFNVPDAMNLVVYPGEDEEQVHYILTHLHIEDEEL